MILLAIALPEERFAWKPGGVTVTTGLTGGGMAYAARALTEAGLTERPDFVINAGTAGTTRHEVGDILVCRKFVDRDLKPLAIEGVTSELSVPRACTSFRSRLVGQWSDVGFSLSTGDTFVTQAEGVECDAVDMEAFAEAQVCLHYGVPFVAVKYITDIIGRNSVAHWAEKLESARVALAGYFAAMPIPRV